MCVSDIQGELLLLDDLHEKFFPNVAAGRGSLSALDDDLLDLSVLGRTLGVNGR